MLCSLGASVPAPDILVIHLGVNSLCRDGQNHLDFFQEVKADLARVLKMLPTTRILFSDILPHLNYRETVQIAAVTGSASQTEDQTNSPYAAVRNLLEEAASGAPPPYLDTSEFPPLQAKDETKKESQRASRPPPEWSRSLPRGKVSAAPIKASYDEERNTEMGAGYERGFRKDSEVDHGEQTLDEQHNNLAKEALKGEKPRMELIEWTEEMEEPFVSIKETLSSCPALRHADARKAFHLWTWVETKSYSAALGQRVPGRTSYGMVGYYSTPIPASMAGQHPCLLICDSAEWAVKATEEIVAHQKVVLHTRHQILKLLTITRLGSISNQRRAKWEAALLSKNVDIQTDAENIINPASLLPDEGTAHNCAQLID
ncbi:NYNRIN-like isoform X2 [Labeo rohita]|uniref:NYNRIN-like isoform X2 n=1 Tax=Labeo rohita TaxID=84645 RepID=A0A498MAN7_LABRO|nr:NYNRIN-like isoform X2 [Labeo rohita]RXN18149.1 NYNRIN-like isoform X2 [Labeo rohita]